MWKSRFESAVSSTGKCAVCIAMIDAGVVYIDQPVEAIRAIFGSSLVLHEKGPSSADFSGTVYCDELPISVDASASTSHSGWYLKIRFDPDGRIISYFLSNLHKPGPCFAADGEQSVETGW